MNTVKSNFDVLEKLQTRVTELESKRAQVGFFQDTAGRSADPGRITDNPSLAFVHEFGCTKNGKNIPERSILRVPLMLKLGKVIEAKGTSWLWLLMQRGVNRTMRFLGAVGEDVVQEAFSTRGYGTWPDLSPITVRRKGSSAVLIESAQLRKAVGFRVV